VSPNCCSALLPEDVSPLSSRDRDRGEQERVGRGVLDQACCVCVDEALGGWAEAGARRRWRHCFRAGGIGGNLQRKVASCAECVPTLISRGGRCDRDAVRMSVGQLQNYASVMIERRRTVKRERFRRAAGGAPSDGREQYEDEPEREGLVEGGGGVSFRGWAGSLILSDWHVLGPLRKQFSSSSESRVFSGRPRIWRTARHRGSLSPSFRFRVSSFPRNAHSRVSPIER